MLCVDIDGDVVDVVVIKIGCGVVVCWVDVSDE